MKAQFYLRQTPKTRVWGKWVLVVQWAFLRIDSIKRRWLWLSVLARAVLTQLAIAPPDWGSIGSVGNDPSRPF